MTKSITEIGPDERALANRFVIGGRDGAPLTPALVDAARRHRMHLLLAASLDDGERSTPLGDRLTRELTVAAAVNGWREDDTRQLLDALARIGTEALVLKGTALAYNIYPAPHLRPRLDVDLLIRREAVDDVERALAANGWTRPLERAAERAEPQRHYVKTGPGATLYHLDLHWRLAIPQLFSQLRSFDELRRSAVPIPALGAAALTLSTLDALLLACVHRVAHHADAIDLLWLWDIHLLLERMNADDAARFVELADLAAATAICARGVALSAELFHSKGGRGIADELHERSMARTEPSARLLGGVAPAQGLRFDLAALAWPDRLGLLAEHLFPTADYMRSRYPRWPRALLPLAYVDRVVRGAPAWFRKP